MRPSLDNYRAPSENASVESAAATTKKEILEGGRERMTWRNIGLKLQ